MSRDNLGFTLVEVIVTAVIVAIISAIAIPNYLGYINQSRQDAVESLAETAAAAANAHWRRTGSAPADSSVLNLHYDGTRFSITVPYSVDSVRVDRIGGSESKTTSFR